jgi:hypothetical protein
VLCAALALAACKAPSAATAANDIASQDKLHPAKEATMPDASIPVPATPTPGEAISAIFEVAGDGSAAYEVENGSWAHFWYGHRFEAAGKQYYTAFVYQTPEKYGKDPAEDFPDPDAQAAITQATFVLADGAKGKHWGLVGAQRHIGDFGAYEKGPTIDADSKPGTYRTPDGHEVLSVPAWVSAPGGIRQQTAELFVLTPADLRWTHVGSVATGEDNSADCEAGASSLVPCTSSKGALRFEPGSADAMPDVVVALSGTTIDDNGQVRELDARASTRYRFNAQESRYDAVQ